MIGLFLFGEDSLEDVRDIRTSCIRALTRGTIVKWNSSNTSVDKVFDVDLKVVLNECNDFLRTYDPDLRKANPIRDRTKPFLW
jgi:hypothetical protein